MASGDGMKARQDKKRIPHSRVFEYLYRCLRYRNIERFVSLSGRNIRLSAEIVNARQNYSIVVHRKGGIDKVRKFFTFIVQSVA